MRFLQTHLFASHRYFLWAYETALRNECGYTGYQPVSRAGEVEQPYCMEL